MELITTLNAKIYDANGSLAGTAIDVMEWNYNENLDGAGDWNMRCRASAANAALLQEGCRADVYATLGGTEQLFSSGRITGIEPAFDVNAYAWNVTGRDRIGDLSDRLIASLDVVELDWTYLNDGKGAVYWLRPTGTATPSGYAETELGPAFDGNLSTWGETGYPGNLVYMHSPVEGQPSSETATWIYVGYDARFNAAKFYLDASATSDNQATMEAQYFDGSGWVTISIVDGTSSGGATWSGTGIVSWERPSDWQRYTGIGGMGNWYWMRFRTAYAAHETYTDYVALAEVSVYADMPTTNGLNLIMAYAPSDWKQSGYAATSKTAYGTINDYSVLEALGWLKEQIGGHFQASFVAGKMQIDWIDTFSDSTYSANGEGSY